MKVITLDIDPDLWDKYKETVSRNLTLNESLIKLIEIHVSKYSTVGGGCLLKKKGDKIGKGN